MENEYVAICHVVPLNDVETQIVVEIAVGNDLPSVIVINTVSNLLLLQLARLGIVLGGVGVNMPR
jgi:hypothetical protein